jgi:hypothetical protein
MMEDDLSYNSLNSANSEKTGHMFSKIKVNNIINIFYFLDFFSLSEVLNLNTYFKQLILKKFQKRMIMITTSLKIYKKTTIMEYNEDLKNLLFRNAAVIRKQIKPLILNSVNDYYYKLPVLRYFFNKTKEKNILKVNLRNCDLNKKSVKYLSYYLENNYKVLKVNISQNKLNSNILLPLCGIIKYESKLNTLKMNECVTDQKTFQHLSKILENISPDNSLRICLKNSNIEDSYIKHFNFSKSRILNLSGNNITNQGVYFMCNSFTNIQWLNLGNNNINSYGAFYFSVFLKDDKSLQYLNLSRNNITEPGVHVLLESLNNNPSHQLSILNLSENIFSNFENIPSLSNLRILKLKIAGIYLELENLTHFFKHFNNNNFIKSLSIGCRKHSYNTLSMLFERLKENKMLEELSITNSYLGTCQHLEVIPNYFSRNECILKKLNLSSNLLHNSKSDLICNILYTNKLQKLNLMNNELNLWPQKDWNLFCRSISQNKMLEDLNLSKNFIKDKVNLLLQELMKNSTLKILNLSCNEIGSTNSTAIYLKAFLEKHPKIHTLNLKSNLINDGGFLIIKDSLLKNKQLKKVNLKHNKFMAICMLQLLDSLALLNQNEPIPRLKLYSQSICQELLKDTFTYIKIKKALKNYANKIELI